MMGIKMHSNDTVEFLRYRCRELEEELIISRAQVIKLVAEREDCTAGWQAYHRTLKWIRKLLDERDARNKGKAVT